MTYPIQNIKSFSFIICFVIFFISSYSQKQANNWYFGSLAGVNFNGGSPVDDPNGLLVSMHGCASISDASGNLLFYTNGVDVWDKNHALMTNGTGLLGNTQSTQSAIIIPMPGNSSLYYIFTTPNNGTNGTEDDSLRYSLVDMTGAGGLGTVTSIKNKALYGVVDENLTATYHRNGTDVWLVTHGYQNDEYVSFLISSTGITVPVISNTGYVETGPTSGDGSMKLSPDGSKIARGMQSSHKLEVCSYDNLNGIVSLPFFNAFHLNCSYVCFLKFYCRQ